MSDFQLTLPRLGSSLGLGQSPYDRVMTGQLQLDPAIEALIYPVQFYLPPTTPDGPPILNITAALTTLADPTKPSLRLGGPVPILQTRDGLPWTVPNPKMRAATSDDVTAAVMGIPQVKSAVTRVEGLASAELARTWKDIRGNKASCPSASWPSRPPMPPTRS